MAKLISPLKIRGTVNDLCFRLQKDGSVIVQSTPGPTPEQVKTGKNFDLTRRNASEFGKVTRDAMLFRHALGYIARALRDPKFNSHVIKRMHQVAFSDTESDYGSRHANKGNLQLLEGFDLNHALSLEMSLPVRLEHSMDVATGTLQLRVPACIVRRKKALPAGATHFKIVSCAGAVDFDKHRYTNNIAESELLPLTKQIPAVELKHSLTGEAGQVMLHTVGMVFYKVEEGKVELLKGAVMRVAEVMRVVLQSPLLACAQFQLPVRETVRRNEGIKNDKAATSHGIEMRGCKPRIATSRNEGYPPALKLRRTSKPRLHIAQHPGIYMPLFQDLADGWNEPDIAILLEIT